MPLTLKTARKIAQLSQVQLAKKSGLAQTTISAIERGVLREPSYTVVCKLARALNVEPNELFPSSEAEQVAP